MGGDIGLGVDGTGIVTVVWGRMNPAVSRTVMYAARRASGQAWSAPVALHEGEFEAGTPTSLVAASRNGDVTVLWSTFKSTRWAASGAEAVSAPTGLTLTTPRIFNNQAQAGERLTVSWSAPATGLPVTSYQLQAGTAPDANDLADLNVGATTQVVATVPAVRNVAVRVRALSGAIAGPWSNGTGFVVFGICGAPAVPASLTSTVAGATVSFTWQPAGGSTSYVLEAGSASGLANIVATNVGIVTRFTAVAPPGTYYVRVRAEGNCGASGPSNEVVVTVAGASAPGVPVLQPPTVNGSTVTLTWSAGSGGPPTGYTLTASTTPGGAPIVTAPLSGTSASFNNVTSGTYYLRLTASNAAGTSSPSAPVTLTVP